MSLCVEGAQLGGIATTLRVEGELIVELGEGLEHEPGDEVIDAASMAIVPGLVNAHTHAAMTLFRGYADDLPLMEWLSEHIWPAEERITADDVYWGARLACLEMIRTGTVCFWDMYWQPGATARAVADAGLRATIGAPLIDGGDPAGADALEAAALDGLAAVEVYPARISPALAPHAIYTVSADSLERVARISAERELPIHIHLSETTDEVRDCIEAHGCRPAELLDRVGALGPRTLLAHCVWLDDGERELIASRGATVVTNPAANMKLAVGGAFDLPAARAAGLPVGLGTDGAGSNNALDLLAEARLLSLLQKHEAASAEVVPAAEALAIARGERAPLLDPAGPIEAGRRADFLLVRLDSPGLAVGSLDAGLAYASSGAVVDTTVVAGEVLMRGGVVDGADEVIAKARESVVRLGLA